MLAVCVTAAWWLGGHLARVAEHPETLEPVYPSRAAYLRVGGEVAACKRAWAASTSAWTVCKPSVSNR